MINSVRFPCCSIRKNGIATSSRDTHADGYQTHTRTHTAEELCELKNGANRTEPVGENSTHRLAFPSYLLCAQTQ